MSCLKRRILLRGIQYTELTVGMYVNFALAKKHDKHNHWFLSYKSYLIVTRLPVIRLSSPPCPVAKLALDELCIKIWRETNCGVKSRAKCWCILWVPAILTMKSFQTRWIRTSLVLFISIHFDSLNNLVIESNRNDSGGSINNYFFTSVESRFYRMKIQFFNFFEYY